MMAFCELNETNEVKESFDYIEHEILCPFCEEGSILEVTVRSDGVEYSCALCEESWVVLSA